MGYGMSRLEEEYYEPEGQNTDGSSSVQVNDEFSKLHNDIFHMTRIRSGLSESIYKFMGADKGRYVPKNGPELLDRMDSRAYVSQFSADGTLFVAGFQGSHIRIYDVDRGWNIHKDLHARSLRWTLVMYPYHLINVILSTLVWHLLFILSTSGMLQENPMLMPLTCIMDWIFHSMKMFNIHLEYSL